MKPFKKIISVAGSVVMAAVTALSFVGCKPESVDPGKDDDTVHKYRPNVTAKVSDPETRALVMSISTPDGVFNPFFSTSGYDSSIISMTQASMLGANYLGEVVCGDDEPCVVQDWKSTYNVDTDRTTYEFIIKNDMKFSDGTPLTINDVLFNLYVYLDPVYTGSATIYSTKIVGLNAYRTQREDATDKSASAFEESFIVDAGKHVDSLVEYVRAAGQFAGSASDPKPDIGKFTPEQIARFNEDVAYAAKEFRKELENDWNATLDSMESYKDWKFTEPWQVFLFNDGGATELLLTDADGNYIKENGYYQLDPEEAANIKKGLDAYLDKFDIDKNDPEAVASATKTWAVNYVYYSYFSAAIVDDVYTEDAFNADNITKTVSRISANEFEKIVRYWQTADSFLSKTAAELKSAYFEGNEMAIPTISGITVADKRSTDFDGNSLEGEHDVLSIVINGQDPKAIWNFGFTVAPVHYYSGEYKGHDYSKVNYQAGEFGVKFGDSEFMNSVINAPSKIGVPVGAGPYMASTKNGGAAQKASDFMNLNMIYYERNPYFETMGKNIENAKIKNFRYRVVDTDQIINSVATHEIDVGDPSATQENIKTIESANIMHEEIYTSGYGYIGINPRFVPNINVRRAIMKAMDTSSITREYYQGGLADLIYRSMSTTSWAYPKGCGVYVSENGTSYEFDSLGKEIEKLVSDAGYEKGNDGVYSKLLPGFGTDRLDYTFTIAGGSQDHPAYKVFQDAMQLLNRHGFAVKVETSATALTDLTAGKLEIWAAAWSSTIDPDMYQVYHKDSMATSVNNWCYKYIKANKNLYSTEWGIIQDLSDLIDAGRSTLVQSDRASIYSEALDLVMELAVELPTYQRKDMTAYDLAIIDENTLTPESERSPYNGLFARIWEVNYYLTAPNG